MITLAIPVLKAASAERAIAFYRDALGFTMAFAMRGDPEREDPCYIGFERDGVMLHVSSFSGDGVAGAAVVIRVDDVDALHAEFAARNVRIDVAPVDQTWGTREMYVRDPDGNSLRFTSVRRS